MLKACCDCIAGGVREQNDAYGAETVRLNSNPQTTSWSEAKSDTEKMFLLPTKLKSGDDINITGVFTLHQPWISLSLIKGRDGPNGIEPDYNNVACQLYITLGSNEGSIVQKIIMDGQTVRNDIVSDRPQDFLTDLYDKEISESIIGLKLIQDGNHHIVNYYIDSSNVSSITLKHNYEDIRYLILDGAVDKVKKLEFLYS